MQPVRPRFQPSLDGAAIAEAFVRMHQRMLFRFARTLGASSPTAEDFVQDAFLAALHKEIERLPPSEAALWLRGAVRNLWRMHLRSQRRRPSHVDVDALEAEFAAKVGPDGGDARIEAARICLDRLDGRSRRALELRYAENASREAIGRELELGDDGVKSLLRRLRQVVHDCVERRLEGGNE